VLLERADSVARAVLRRVLATLTCQRVRLTYVAMFSSRASMMSVMQRILGKRDCFLGVDVSSPSFCEFELRRGNTGRGDRSGGRVYGKTA